MTDSKKRRTFTPVPGVIDPDTLDALDDIEPPNTDAAGKAEGKPDAEHAHSITEAKAVTKRRAQDLGLLVARYVRRHLPKREPAAPSVPESPPRLKGRLGQILPIMQLIPWLLGALFAVSFFWDFPGASQG